VALLKIPHDMLRKVEQRLGGYEQREQISHRVFVDVETQLENQQTTKYIVTRNGHP